VRIGGWIIAAALMGSSLAGCAVSRYPIAPTWSAADAGTLTCAQLEQERDAAALTERRIAEIARTGRAADGSRPVLYSTAKADADRAVQARGASIADALRAGGCRA
jgi:hypothetical protein